MNPYDIFLQISNFTQNNSADPGLKIDPTWIIAAGTALLVIINWWFLKESNKNTKRQLELTSKELQSRLRADLMVIIGETNLTKKEDGKYEGKVHFYLKNIGKIPARHITVYYKDPTSSLDIEQLIRDWNEIRKSSFSITGIIPPDITSEALVHKTPREEYKSYQIAVWVTYDYADVKSEEFIQIIDVNAQSYTMPIIYDKKSIEEARKNLKSKGLPF